MKKVININFQGRVIPIEETAYDMLQQYVDSLRKYFANEEGREEIISDIEDRIAELFAETLKKGGTCITDADVTAIIASIGRPEEFEGEEVPVQEKTTQTNTGSGTQYTYVGGDRKLYRSENDKVIAGVCAGIANYFGIDPLIVRIIFVLGLGALFVPYLILWIAIPSTATQVIGSTRKRLFRNPDDKIIAGVCSGLGQYFGINPWIPRVLFLIPFISFAFGWSHFGFLSFPHFMKISFNWGATIIYIILWMVLPEAKTASEKLEMKGEKVDLNSIKNTVSEDLKGFQDRLQKMGKEASEYAREKSRQFNGEAGTIARKTSTGLGDVIALIAKIIAYTVLGFVAFGVAAGLFGLAVVLTGLLPVKDYIIEDGWQNILTWSTLILGIWVPVIAIITFIIRRIAKIKSRTHVVRYAFLSLWILGVASAVALIISLTQDFRSRARFEEDIVLANPAVNRLELKADKDIVSEDEDLWFNIEPFATLNEDTVRVKNVRVRIMQSENDSFRVKLIRFSQGSSKAKAQDLIQQLDYNIQQKDDVLLTSNGFAVTTKNKFRNQRVEIIVYVPVGKRIKISDDVAFGRRGHIEFGPSGDWRWNDYDDEYSFEFNKEYVMTPDGLERTGRDVEEVNPTAPATPDSPAAPADKKEEERYRYEQTSFLHLKDLTDQAIKKVAISNDDKEDLPLADLTPSPISLLMMRY